MKTAKTCWRPNKRRRDQRREAGRPSRVVHTRRDCLGERDLASAVIANESLDARACAYWWRASPFLAEKLGDSVTTKREAPASNDARAAFSLARIAARGRRLSRRP